MSLASTWANELPTFHSNSYADGRANSARGRNGGRDGGRSGRGGRGRGGRGQAPTFRYPDDMSNHARNRLRWNKNKPPADVNGNEAQFCSTHGWGAHTTAECNAPSSGSAHTAAHLASEEDSNGESDNESGQAFMASSSTTSSTSTGFAIVDSGATHLYLNKADADTYAKNFIHLPKPFSIELAQGKIVYSHTACTITIMGKEFTAYVVEFRRSLIGQALLNDACLINIQVGNVLYFINTRDKTLVGKASINPTSELMELPLSPMDPVPIPDHLRTLFAMQEGHDIGEELDEAHLETINAKALSASRGGIYGLSHASLTNWIMFIIIALGCCSKVGLANAIKDKRLVVPGLTAKSILEKGMLTSAYSQSRMTKPPSHSRSTNSRSFFIPEIPLPKADIEINKPDIKFGPTPKFCKDKDETVLSIQLPATPDIDPDSCPPKHDEPRTYFAQLHQRVFTDEIGRIPGAKPMRGGYTSILVIFEENDNFIWCGGVMPGAGGHEKAIQDYATSHTLKNRPFLPAFYFMDNKCSASLKNFFNENNIKYELDHVDDHRHNQAERAIYTAKNTIIAHMITADVDLPAECLIDAALYSRVSLNIARPSPHGPSVSAFEARYKRPYDIVYHPLVPFGCTSTPSSA